LKKGVERKGAPSTRENRLTHSRLETTQGNFFCEILSYGLLRLTCGDLGRLENGCETMILRNRRKLPYHQKQKRGGKGVKRKGANLQ